MNDYVILGIVVAILLGGGVYLMQQAMASRRAVNEQRLPESESVLRLLDQMASDTFESDAEAFAWLRRPHPLLDGETPIEVAKNAAGAQRVKDILQAIKYGGIV